MYYVCNRRLGVLGINKSTRYIGKYSTANVYMGDNAYATVFSIKNPYIFDRVCSLKYVTYATLKYMMYASDQFSIDFLAI